MLFTLDSRPFEAAVRQAEAAVRQAEAAVKQAEATRKQAEAAVVKDKALAKNAKTEADRAQTLLKQGAYTQEQYDNAQANQAAMDAAVDADIAAVAAAAAAMDAAQANVDAGKAAVENAKMQLSFCTIRSPMDGRAGSRTVDVGNIIKAVDVQPMVVINQVHPIYVGFSIPEQQLPLVKKYLNDQEKMKVEAIIPGDPGLPATGELTFIDNAIDAATGTILLKGTFPNDDRRLWPGQYVNVVLTLSRAAERAGHPQRGGADRPARAVRLRAQERPDGRGAPRHDRPAGGRLDRDREGTPAEGTGGDRRPVPPGGRRARGGRPAGG